MPTITELIAKHGGSLGGPTAREQAEAASAGRFRPSFPSRGGFSERTGAIFGTVGEAAAESARLVGNIPSSGFNLARNLLKAPLAIIRSIRRLPGEVKATIGDFGGDVGAAALETAKAFPGALGQVLLPKFVQSLIKGNTEEAQRDIVNDPVGQILPLILSARAVAHKISPQAGANFDQGIATLGQTVTKPVAAAAQKVASGVGSATSQVFGATTGTGSTVIRDAFQAGVRKSQAFREAITGRTRPQDIVDRAHGALEAIKQKRQIAVTQRLQKLDDNISVDLSPVKAAVNAKLKGLNVKFVDKVDDAGNVTGRQLDFSQSSIGTSTDQNAVSRIVQTIDDWDDVTPSGLDRLKQNLDDSFIPGKGGIVGVTAKNAVRTELNSKVSGYQELTRGISEVFDLQNDLQRAFGLGKRTATNDQVFTRLTNAIKGNKPLKQDLINVLDEFAPGFSDSISGLALSPAVPQSLAARVGGFGLLAQGLSAFFSPQAIIGLMATSPRIMGEFANAIGLGVGRVKNLAPVINDLAIRQLTGPAGTGAVVAAPGLEEAVPPPEGFNF